ncbi:MAG: hypothetical protein JWP18_1913, partial [Solirubrobacterales bacterium]|nr:hypothetical protein [Solirubrobacterales bacterium]
GAVATARAADALTRGAPQHAVHRIGGHRLLLVGPAPLPDVTAARGLRVWPEGIDLPTGVLGDRDVVIAARGACAGIARRLGATVVHPDGATGDTDTDLRAKAAAVLAAIDGGARRVVVHLGGADEASHCGDAEAKVAFLGRVDHELLPAVADVVRRAGGTLRVQPDHGCDPRTGAHDAYPVPCLTWTATAPSIGPALPAGARPAVRTSVETQPRLTERGVASLPVVGVMRAHARARA